MSVFSGDPTVASTGGVETGFTYKLCTALPSGHISVDLLSPSLFCQVASADPTPTLPVLLVTVKIQGLHCPVVCDAEPSLFIFHWSPLRFGVTSGCLPCPCGVLFCHSCGCDLDTGLCFSNPEPRGQS